MPRHLAPYASDPQKSRGRQFAASDSPTRSEFQRDRDRIIHSTAFRRLQHKTQVFLHHEGNHFRTRLTHTLEVSQIARSIARVLNLNEDLAEAVALAHDLGHTPFGHAGERALDRAMAPWGGFDHNLQSLRVLVMLENRYADHDGLNLTWETLEGTLKHNGPLHGEVDLSFLGDSLDLETGTHASLEAQVAAIADDIAYDSHDIDDALRAGVLCFEQLGQVPLLAELLGDVDSRWPNLSEQRRAHELQRRLITRFVETAIATSAAAIENLSLDSSEAVRAHATALIRFSPQIQEQERQLKQFLFAQVYRAPDVMERVRQAERIVSDLFGAYMEKDVLPAPWQQRADAASDLRARARIVADYIAGMTDPFARAEHQRIFP